MEIKTAEDILKEKNRDIISVRGDQQVCEAVKVMSENNIGAILIKADYRYVGIFSERDLLRNSASPGFDPDKEKIADYMSAPLHSVEHDTSLVALKEKFLGLYIRHLVVEKEGRQMGLLSIGDVMRASLLDQDRQIKELNKIASWDYYEDWGWDRKKGE